MRRLAKAAAVLALAACGQSSERNAATGEAGPSASELGDGDGWDVASSGEGIALVFGAGGQHAIRLLCLAGEQGMLVNVPSFRAIGSEERLSLGGGGEVVALVADTRGDPARGGVSATGEVPSELGRILSGPVSASYGAQNSGPHPAPPAQLARAFASACGETAEQPLPPTGQPQPQPASACRQQDGRPVPANALRAIGTEPFWGARIDGRCVTYSHPDDQAGTRIWTRFSGSRDNGIWSGALDGRRFELRTRPRPGCSDGMSDNLYPIAVELFVHGERRTGCAVRL